MGGLVEGERVTDLRRYADRLSPEDRAAMLSGFGCTTRELEPWAPRSRRERKPKPAPPHQYHRVTIYDIPNNEIIVGCSTTNCQDDTHRVRAALEPRP